MAMDIRLTNNFTIKMNPLLRKQILAVFNILVLLNQTIASPVWMPQFLSGGQGRNIRHLPCLSRRTGEQGICMFAYTCMKANGTHLGTCIDRFYFGSCCRLEQHDDLINEQDINYQLINDNKINKVPAIVGGGELSTIAQILSSQTPKVPIVNTELLLKEDVVNTTIHPPSTHILQANDKTTEIYYVPVANVNATELNNVSTTTQSYLLSTFQVVHDSSTVSTTQPTKITSAVDNLTSVVISTWTPTTQHITNTTLKPDTSLKDSNDTVLTPVTLVTVKTPTTTYKTTTTTTTKKPSKPVRITTTTTRKPPVKKPTTKPITKPTTSKPKPTSTKKPPAPVKKPVTTTKPTVPVKVTTTEKPTTTTPKTTTTKVTTTGKPTIVKKTTTTTKPSTTETTTKTTTTTKHTTSKPVTTSTYNKTTSTISTVHEPVSTVRPLGTESSSLTTANLTTTTTTTTSKPSVATFKPVLITGPGLTTFSYVSEDVKVTSARPTTTTTSTVVISNDITSTKPLIDTAGTETEVEEENTNVIAEKPASITSSSTTEAIEALSNTSTVSLTSISTESNVPKEPWIEITQSTTESNLTTISTSTSSSTTISNVFDQYNTTDYKQICGRRMFPESRVVGGEKSSFGKWPWQISLRQWRTSTYLHKCGAALLSENWAITAAHCVENVPPSDLLLRLGEHDLSTEDEPYGFQERRVQIVASHPQFDPRTFEYDLALLRFYEPVKFQPNIVPICIPEDDTNFVGRTAFVTGWGRLYEDGPLPSVLQEVSVPVINNTLCENMYRAAGYIEHIPEIFICAGWKKGGFDSCEGDSGGPMVIQRPDKRWLLAGVISWGIGCAEPNQPGVYTRISEFREWIHQILQF